MIVKWAKDKPIMECKVSARNIQNKYNRLPKKLKEKKRQKKISLSTANRILNKYIGKPRMLRKVFYLKQEEKQLRLNFLKFMRDKNIGPEDIFFTDESIFPLKAYLNKGTNKIRLCKKTQRKIKSGDERAINLRIRPQPKFNKGIMVSGGICEQGLGKLIFHSGNVNSFAYKQVLKFYREDLNLFPAKIFQQDGARSHSSKLSRNIIKALFKDKYIPTWEGESFPRWPPNSPDLSAIEIIWSIIKQMLILFPPKDLQSLKETIQKIWESIPKKVCKNIITHMKERWALCIKYKGRRLDKELLKKIPSERSSSDLKINIKNPIIGGIRVSYNDKFILRLKKKEIKLKKDVLKTQRKTENEAKMKLDKLLKMKPNEYKNISNKEKNETQFQYYYEKAKTEVIEKKIKDLEGMCALDYLNLINEETKEKLIGLCLNRKLLSLDGETEYEEGEESDESMDEMDETSINI